MLLIPGQIRVVLRGETPPGSRPTLLSIYMLPLGHLVHRHDIKLHDDRICLNCDPEKQFQIIANLLYRLNDIRKWIFCS